MRAAARGVTGGVRGRRPAVVHTPSVAERLALESPLERWLRQQGEALSLGSSWISPLPGTSTRPRFGGR